MKKNYDRVYCFDLDGTLCTNTEGEYENAQPLYEAIKKVNNLYNSNYIIIFTARYMGKSKGDIQKAKNMGYQLTLNQLYEWRVKFDELIFGKPYYDIIVDDKSFNYSNDWINKI